MGTRSRIAVRNADNTYTSIYCHWDGYPAHVGAILQKHYGPGKAGLLMKLGDLSSLAEDIGQTHDFHDNTRRDWCTFYGRDRGEEAPAQQSPDLDALLQLTQDCGGEWLYVWTGHGWQCAKGGSSAFGMPATEKPGGLESIDYWLQKAERDSRNQHD